MSSPPVTPTEPAVARPVHRTGPHAHAACDTRAVPRRSPAVFRWFSRYAHWYVRRHFHQLRVSRAGTFPTPPRGPLVVYVNHASWWDPLVCLLLDRRCFRERAPYAPIDAQALDRYRFFARLGFFGVEPGTRAGALTFLRAAEAILHQPDTTLWLTPQGRFADVRERPVRFAGGLGHLAVRVPEATFVPVALEYVHWEEKLPEVLIRFGEPVRHAAATSADTATTRLEAALADSQDALAAESIRRDPDAFDPWLSGGAGVGGTYDLWRRLRARLAGRTFKPEHGTK